MVQKNNLTPPPPPPLHQVTDGDGTKLTERICGSTRPPTLYSYTHRWHYCPPIFLYAAHQSLLIKPPCHQGQYCLLLGLRGDREGIQPDLGGPGHGR